MQQSEWKAVMMKAYPDFKTVADRYLEESATTQDYNTAFHRCTTLSMALGCIKSEDRPQCNIGG